MEVILAIPESITNRRGRGKMAIAIETVCADGSHPVSAISIPETPPSTASLEHNTTRDANKW